MQEPTRKRDGDGVILLLLLLVAAYMGWPRVVAWQSSAREARRASQEATVARRPALEAPAEPDSRDKRPKDAPDLSTAMAKGLIEPRIRGDGISRIKVHLQPCGEEPPSPVVIPAGTYLRSPGGDVQNMMTIRTVVAEPGVETEVRPSAAMRTVPCPIPVRNSPCSPRRPRRTCGGWRR
jgi:hypothetical protein